ncbi:hypothetical protein L484_017471 [Morus notabilis]|uniref:Disease resistance protein n=1 Tax=Morus notabilis TaxID=981085 RepID=W9QLA2_9ROSA|nr:hypothetical protein L484_017471 [Morus notabilis]
MSDELCQDLKFLSSVTISKCPCFVSFPKGGLRAPNLTHISFVGCKKLKSLPEKMHNLLPSLEVLRIEHCPEIESFPCSLSTLVIACCHKLIATRSNWNLQRLPNLTQSTIFEENEVVESFPEEGLLPSTITDLSIEAFSSLKALDKNGLQQLTSLKSLETSFCPELQILPEEGLPTSLEYLSIDECPLLEKKCNREYWSKIDRIFCVLINCHVIS